MVVCRSRKPRRHGLLNGPWLAATERRDQYHPADRDLASVDAAAESSRLSATSNVRGCGNCGLRPLGNRSSAAQISSGRVSPRCHRCNLTDAFGRRRTLVPARKLLQTRVSSSVHVFIPQFVINGAVDVRAGRHSRIAHRCSVTVRADTGPSRGPCTTRHYLLFSAGRFKQTVMLGSSTTAFLRRFPPRLLLRACFFPTRFTRFGRPRMRLAYPRWPEARCVRLIVRANRATSRKPARGVL